MTPSTRPLVASLRFLALLLMPAIIWPLQALGSQLSLSWVEASQEVLGFLVERSVGIAGPFTILATTGAGITVYTDASAADSTIYCYRVRAFNSAGYSTYSAPACGAAPPAKLTLALDINQQTFDLGEGFRVDVTLTNSGPVAVVDVYSGSILPPAAGPALGCPDGDAVAYLVDALAGLDGFVFRCLSEGPSRDVSLYSGVSVGLPILRIPDFFGFNWPDTTPGNYTSFMFLTQAGTANVIAVGTATISYAP
jgi:hypothetical protein